MRRWARGGSREHGVEALPGRPWAVRAWAVRAWAVRAWAVRVWAISVRPTLGASWGLSNAAPCGLWGLGVLPYSLRAARTSASGTRYLTPSSYCQFFMLPTLPARVVSPTQAPMVDW